MPDKFMFVSMRMIEDDSPVDADALEGSAFFDSAMSFDPSVWVAEAGEHAWELHQTRVWDEIEHQDGHFVFDIGIPLPFFLPTIDKKCEYALEVSGRRYIVSNRMVQCFEGAGKTDGSFTQYFLTHRVGVPELIKTRGVGLHVLPLKTFICARFECGAASATEAIRDNFSAWRNELVSAIERIVEAMRHFATDAPTPMPPVPGITAYSVMWVVIHGANRKRAFRQFSASMGAAALRSMANIDSSMRPKLEAVLAGIDVLTTETVALALARSFSLSHHADLAIVQICIACEVALTRAYHAFLRLRGVSQRKLDDMPYDVATLAALLGVHLYTIRDVSKFPNSSERLGRLKWARDRRNEIAHGKSRAPMPKRDVDMAIDAAAALIAFLNVPTEDSSATPIESV